MKKNDASRKALRIIGSILVAIALWIYVDTVTSPEVTLKVKMCRWNSPARIPHWQIVV